MARSHVLATTALVVSSALVTGCAGSADGPARTGTTPVPASSTPPADPLPTSSPRVEPVTVPDPPAHQDSPAGRRALAHHVVDLWGHALRTNDAEPLLALSPRKEPCAGCTALAEELADREAEGWYVDFPGVAVQATELDRTGERTVATMTVAIPESDSYDEDGSYRGTNPAHDDVTFVVEMRSTGEAFRLLSFTLR